MPDHERGVDKINDVVLVELWCGVCYHTEISLGKVGWKIQSAYKEASKIDLDCLSGDIGTDTNVSITPTPSNDTVWPNTTRNVHSSCWSM